METTALIVAIAALLAWLAFGIEIPEQTDQEWFDSQW